jgi:hypothetical protein
MTIKEYVKRHKKSIGIAGVVTGAVAGVTAAILMKKKKKTVKPSKESCVPCDCCSCDCEEPVKKTAKKIVKKAVKPVKKIVKKAKK